MPIDPAPEVEPPEPPERHGHETGTMPAETITDAGQGAASDDGAADPTRTTLDGTRGSGLDSLLDAKIPTGPIETAWARHKFNLKLVNPANKRKYTIIVVGSGLAGGAAAASLAELGYHVKNFCYQDSPRRAHSIAAQGGINAAKNYRNDGDSVYRLFYDTVKGGDFRAR
ncbi:MAG TPA: FAD-binding protein, partial [Mycobacteriales bacterium]|nr:FAD-binding protein [Mycobacteriales bacterium]